MWRGRGGEGAHEAAAELWTSRGALPQVGSPSLLLLVLSVTLGKLLHCCASVSPSPSVTRMVGRGDLSGLSKVDSGGILRVFGNVRGKKERVWIRSGRRAKQGREPPTVLGG